MKGLLNSVWIRLAIVIYELLRDRANKRLKTERHRRAITRSWRNRPDLLAIS